MAWLWENYTVKGKYGSVYHEQNVVVGAKTDYSGLGLAAIGFAIDGAEYEMFNKNTWFSLYKMKSYNQSFNGNGYTGGKIAHAKFWSKGLDYTGKLMGAYQARSILLDYQAKKINTTIFLGEQSSNLYSTFGGIYGAMWGIGWESGRVISKTDWYHQNLFLMFNPAGRDGLLSTYK